MKKSNQKPVIFLAFANDRVREGGYLRNLPEELRSIRDALDKAKNAGLCDIVERANATIDDIMNVFQDEAYKDRIAIFHYGGHANSYKLLLEDFAGGPSSAYKEGLASFFALQTSLELIFLNACSTVQHALELTNAGVPAVIGTLEEIEDNVAFILAARFYNGIANGLPLERAWHEAEYEIHIRFDRSDSRTMYQDGKAGAKERFPWEIHYKEGAEKVKEWNLPDAVNNPLFGFPPIPKTHNLPETPFVFLDRCRRQHAELFFGRSYYIRRLYNLSTGSSAQPIILLFGQSGVGKSSLLEAGLLPRLEETHTCLYIRRKQEKGLLGTLEEALNKSFSGGPGGRFFKKAPLVAEGTKPLLIILDQVEEAYTRYNKNFPNEMEEFAKALKPLYRSPAAYPGINFILSFRKEYQPEIETQFKNHGLPRVPVYLQPLNRDNIIEVVTGLTTTQRLKDKYCLEVEEPLPVIIADDLLEDKGSPVAPTLQIILTKMWQASKTDKFSPHRRFSIEQYQELRKQGLLMEDFFKQQMEKMGIWKKEVIDSGLALDILRFHTTSLGTACSREIEKIRQMYSHRSDIIDALVGKLKDIYLLTDSHDAQNGDETRLVHDTLAPIVIKEYNDSDKPGQRAARILASKIGDFKVGKENIFLDEIDLKTVDQGKNGMKALKPVEIKLLEASRKHKARQERLIKGYKIARGILIILVLIFAAIAAWQWNMASDREKTATANYLASQAQLKVEQNPTIALRLAEKAQQLDNNQIVKGTIYKIYRENNFYKITARQDNPVTTLSVSPGGNYILAGSGDGMVRIWDIKGNPVHHFRAHSGQVLSTVFSPGGSHILTGSTDKTARLWNFYGKKVREFKGHQGWVLSAAFSPGGSFILTGSMDKTARLWDRQGKEGKEVRVIKGHTGRVYAVTFSPDGKFILTGSSDHTARLWNLQGNQLQEFKGNDSSVTAAAFSPGGKYILTGFANSNVRLWDLKGNPLQDFIGHEDRVLSTAFSSDGKHILTASNDGTARLWNLAGTQLQLFNGHEGPVTAAVFSPDSRYILTGSKDKTLRMWQLKSVQIQDFTGHDDRVYCVAFSPDGRQILTGSKDRTVCLWDLEGNQLKVFTGHEGSVTAVAISPEGKHILAQSEDGTVLLWDLKGNQLQNFKSPENIGGSTAVSPDGKYTLTGSEDGSVCLQDIEGNEIQIFKGHEASVTSVAFSPGGKYILTGSIDKTARLWEIHMPLQDFLKNGVCEPLSREQLKEYGIEEK
jgi:WD40 repeat protein